MKHHILIVEYKPARAKRSKINNKGIQIHMGFFLRRSHSTRYFIVIDSKVEMDDAFSSTSNSFSFDDAEEAAVMARAATIAMDAVTMVVILVTTWTVFLLHLHITSS